MSLSFAMVAIALVVPLALWLSVRMAAVSDLSLMPASCRNRMHWWETHAHLLYAVSAVVAVAGLALGPLSG